MKKYVGSVFWDVGGELTSHSAADWDCWGKGVSVQRCGELYLQEIRAKKHGIVLMHDVHGKTVDMMKQILPTLKAEGYKFAALTDVPSVKRAIGAVSGGDRGRRLAARAPRSVAPSPRTRACSRAATRSGTAARTRSGSPRAAPPTRSARAESFRSELGPTEAQDDAEPAAREVEQVDRDVDPEEDVEPTREREDPDVARVVVQEAQERRDELRDAPDDRLRLLLDDGLVVRLDRRRVAAIARAGGRSS